MFSESIKNHRLVLNIVVYFLIVPSYAKLLTFVIVMSNVMFNTVSVIQQQRCATVQWGTTRSVHSAPTGLFHPVSTRLPGDGLACKTCDCRQPTAPSTVADTTTHHITTGRSLASLLQINNTSCLIAKLSSPFSILFLLNSVFKTKIFSYKIQIKGLW